MRVLCEFTFLHDHEVELLETNTFYVLPVLSWSLRVW
jgi:hypothetical protein